MGVIPILMYHHVADRPAGAGPSCLFVRPAAFARQMHFLRWAGFRGLSVSQAMPYLRGERRGRVAIITFDDGYLDNLVHALPVLRRHGFAATCYAVSGRIGGCNDWDARLPAPRGRLMGAAELRHWLEAGMEVGAHSRTHPHLPACSDAELGEEVAGCKAEMEGLLGRAVTQFCYPYGEHDARVIAAARGAGYVAAVTVRPGRAEPGGDLMALPRIAVDGGNSLPVLAIKVLTAYTDRRPPGPPARRR